MIPSGALKYDVSKAEKYLLWILATTTFLIRLLLSFPEFGHFFVLSSKVKLKRTETVVGSPRQRMSLKGSSETNQQDVKDHRRGKSYQKQNLVVFIDFDSSIWNYLKLKEITKDKHAESDITSTHITRLWMPKKWINFSFSCSLSMSNARATFVLFRLDIGHNIKINRRP